MLAGLLVVLLLVGFTPTRRAAGTGGVLAMLAGCAAGLAGSLFGSLWLRARAATVSVDNVISVLLGSLAMRPAVAAVLGAGLLLTNVFAPKPLLLWVAISHAALLVVDTRYALTVAGQLNKAPAAKSAAGLAD